MTSFDVASRTLSILSPEIFLIVFATIMITLGAFFSVKRQIWSTASAVALVTALFILCAMRQPTIDPYAFVALNDPLSLYARIAFLVTGLIVLGLAHDQVDDSRAAEFFGSLLLMNVGAMIVAASNDIVLLFAGLELVSLPTYLLLYLSRRDAGTREAATKYFFLSIFSSALLLFGLAYLYGLAGITNLRALSYLIIREPSIANTALGTIAVVFVMSGLCFRVAAVPFHFYAPDVYEGSPTVIAALLAWVPKGIGFLGMIRALTTVIGGANPIADRAIVLTWVLAAITMILGNTLALAQRNLKRLLAYSSIAHAGYLLIGVTVAFGKNSVQFSGIEAILFYLTSYALMTLGAFGVVIALSTRERSVETIDDLAGLGSTHPAAALGMAFCLFSLAGVPPFAGFFAKFWIFASALSPEQVGQDSSLLWLAIIGCLNAAAGAFYYLRIIVLMYFQPAPSVPLAPKAAWPTLLAVGTCASLSLFVGLYSWPVVQASRASAVAASAHSAPGFKQAAARVPVRNISAR